MNTTSPAPGLAALGLVSIVLILGGCTAYDAAAHGSVETNFTNATEFAREHSGIASWLPADAQAITAVDSTRAENTMTVRYDSATEPEGCEAVPRTSSPTMDVESDIDVYSIDSVLLCDDWAIAHEGNQWLAWTPATEAD